MPKKLKRIVVGDTLVYLPPRKCSAKEAREMVRHITLQGLEEAREMGADRYEVQYLSVVD